MNRSFLDFGLPVWWVLPAIIVSFGLAYWLYSKPRMPWSKNQNLLLGSLRFLALLLILLLFLNPLIRQVTNDVERPIVLFGVDNSASIPAIHSSEELNRLTSQLADLQTQLTDNKDYRVELKPFIGDSLSFDAPYTDVAGFLKDVDDAYLGENVAAVLLVTDGIYNRGISPTYRSYAYPVYTIGLGDTIPRRDVAIREVKHNAIAYQGNEFPLRVDIAESGYDGQSAEVQVRKGAVLVASEKTVLNASGNRLTFFISADQQGLHRYTVSVSSFEGESSKVNNTYDVFIEVLESKKKVRIAAKSPHPDIRAIRCALEETGNYDILVDIASLQKPVTERSFDVQILFDDMEAIGKGSGIWRIWSETTRDALTNVPFLSVAVKGRPDKVGPSYNTNFTKFKLNREVERMKRFPPLSVPFGDYQLSGPAEVLLFQQVGSVTTNKPLLAVFDDGNQRQAVQVGAGIWQWKLQEAARHSDEFLFAELVQKLVQYLSINESKQQFRVNRGMDIFTDGDIVFFDVEIYDDIFQPLEGQPYSLDITGADGASRRFDFVFGAENKQARTTLFPSGTYQYKATTSVGNKQLTQSGEFVVNALQLEQRSLTANHDLLRLLSQKSGGTYAHVADYDSMEEALMQSDFRGIIRSDTNREPIVKVFWILLLILGLVSVEWILRKYWGAY